MLPRGRPKKENKPEEQISLSNQSDQLVNLMENFSRTLQELTLEVMYIKAKMEEPKVEQNILVAPQPQAIQMPISTTSTFLSQVPSDFLMVANEVLGEKFKFECIALPDQPAFAFTVIVPQEYTSVKLPEIDKRIKVIQNILGVNGVKEWCLLVKQNVVKFIGNNLTKTTI